MSIITESTTIMHCACGGVISEDNLALARMFPRIIRTAQCDACSEREAAEERSQREAIDHQREMIARESRLDVIPPEMLRSRINHPTFNAGLWTRIEGWQPSSLKWLGIVGGAGECKTRCMALLARRLILTGHRLMWTTAVEFQERVEETLGGSHGDKQAARSYLNRCKNTAILVLDDFGKNTWNATVEKSFFSVIDYRKTHDLPVLWTANSSPLEILATGGLSRDRGAPLIGRLLEASTIEKV